MSGSSILFVDDDPDLCQLALALLSGAGHRVRIAESAAAAKEQVSAERPDLLITDAVMPGDGGTELCADLRADPASRHLPVLIITCREGEPAAAAAGATAFLSKPLDAGRLVETVDFLVPATEDGRLLCEALEGLRGDGGERGFAELVAFADARPGTEAAAWARYHAAGWLEERGDLEGAARLQEALLAGEPDFWRAHGRLSRLRRRLGALDRAVEHARASLAVNPSQPDVLQDLQLLELVQESGPDALDQAAAAPPDEPQGDAATPPPSPAPPAQPKAPEAPATPPVLEDGGIVVADDDPDMARFLAAVLRSAGYAVRVIDDGKEALAAVRAHKPDLVLVDGLMPGKTGFEVSKAIKTTLYPEDPPKVIMVTAIYTKTRQRHEAEELFGIDEVLAKPVTPEGLLAAVRGQLGPT